MALALALSMPAASAVAAAPAIDHVPVECVRYDRYTRIVATAGEGIAAAQLHFRAGDGGWYSVAMTAGAGGTEWSAVLPRPIRPLARLDYRIVARTSGAIETSTAPVSARVGDDPECGRAGQSSPDVAAPIVVQVPKGAPLVPPVPAGFSPAGVVAAEAPERSSTLKRAAIGAGLAAGVAAGVLLQDDDALSLEDILVGREVVFSGIAPAAGSVLSFSRDRVSVFVDLRGRRTAPFTISWNFDLIGVGGNTVCAFMGGRTSVPSAPATVTLTGPLLPLNACGERFDVDRARLRVTWGTQSLIQEVPAPFHIEP